MSKQVHTGIRLPENLIERIDKIAKRMSRPGIDVTRAEVLRLAATMGVERLEKEGKR